MKSMLIVAIFGLFTAGVNAQTGMPKELTCTEEAFNFSVSLGAKWKFSAPKMGPVEIVNYKPGDIPAWSFKINNITPKTQTPPTIATPFNKGQYLLPPLHFNPTIDYILRKPTPPFRISNLLKNDEDISY